MVEKIKVPEYMLNDIEESSKELSKSEKIKSGVMHGIHEPEDDSIRVKSKQDYYPKRVENPFLFWWNKMKNYPKIFQMIKEELKFDQNLEEGEEKGEVYYFSNFGEELFNDSHLDFLNSTSSETAASSSVPRSMLIYSVDREEFHALGEDKQPISVESINPSDLKNYKY